MLDSRDLALFADPTSYRPNVGCIIVKDQSKSLVLVAQRHDSIASGCWQFPQGGVELERDKSLESAMLREVEEELGIDKLDVLHRTNGSIRYDFPAQYKNSLPNGRSHFKGQEQVWYLGSIAQPDWKFSPSEEFAQVQWVTPQEALNLVVDFKRPVYQAVLQEFNLL